MGTTCAALNSLYVFVHMVCVGMYLCWCTCFLRAFKVRSSACPSGTFGLQEHFHCVSVWVRCVLRADGPHEECSLWRLEATGEGQTGTKGTEG